MLQIYPECCPRLVNGVEESDGQRRRRSVAEGGVIGATIFGERRKERKRLVTEIEKKKEEKDGKGSLLF